MQDYFMMFNANINFFSVTKLPLSDYPLVTIAAMISFDGISETKKELGKRTSYENHDTKVHVRLI